tara:strand:- start:636 stop:1811 length:1176 start_codon:yes stop_codon:yes gene_type:complete
MSYETPFEGIKVVDISQGVAGPYAGMLMAQYGADVIKVEPPEGEWGRFIIKDYDKHSAFSVCANLGKRSIALDLKSEEGVAVVWRMIEDADVFIENFRPGVTARLGFSYDEVSRINPGIIYVSVSGFGPDGPMRDRPAMDPVLQAFSGLMSVNQGGDGVPHRIGVVICDMATALYAFQALSTALYARRNEDVGCLIDTNLMQGAACLSAVRMMSVYMDQGAVLPGRVPYGVFETKDGFVTILTYKEEDYSALCDLLDLPELKDDPRYKTNALRIENEETLMPVVLEGFKNLTCEEVTKGLTEARILHERVNSYLDFLEHPQVEANGIISWLEHAGIGRVPVPNIPGIRPFESGTPLAHSPGVGEHSREILVEHGYGDTEADDLIDRKVVLG